KNDRPEGGRAKPEDVPGDALPAGATARLGTLRFRTYGAIWSLAVAPTSGVIATGGEGWWVYLWDPESGREVGRFDGEAGWVSSLAFTADGTLLASAPGDRTVRVWELRGNKEVRRFSAPEGPVNSVTFAPDGRAVVSCGDDSVCLWDMSTGKMLHR